MITLKLRDELVSPKQTLYESKNRGIMARSPITLIQNYECNARATLAERHSQAVLEHIAKHTLILIS